MKYILLITLMIINGHAFSASVISYSDKTKDENVFMVINSSQITHMIYDEDDQELTIYISVGSGIYDWKFSVKTVSESKILMHKILDKNGTSMIELVRK